VKMNCAMCTGSSMASQRVHMAISLHAKWQTLNRTSMAVLNETVEYLQL
jgi:hypothetical protein